MEYTINMMKDKETENTVRYKAVLVEGQAPVITTLYVPKWACGGKNSITVVVTI